MRMPGALRGLRHGLDKGRDILDTAVRIVPMPEVTQTSHYRAGLAIARSLRAAGHQAFFAGGCVRDLLLGLTPKDVDVATSATPDEIIALFPKTFAVGAHFGVVLVCQRNAEDGKPGEIAVEVATFRHDGAYSDGRRPDAVRFSTSPEDDMRRRDFTINGMLLDPLVFETYPDLADRDNPALLDLVGGRDDLAARAVRAIGDPCLRFAEDKLRMLRAVRFAARLGFCDRARDGCARFSTMPPTIRSGICGAHSRRAYADAYRRRRAARL